MNEILTLKCPAKLNLNLIILDKRDDGLHNISSIFQLIDLSDVMTIKRSGLKSKSIIVNSDKSLNNENNIVSKVIDSLELHSQKKIFCDIRIKKNIPIGGGMGGGSSNAAAALVGINSLFNLNISINTLRKIGRELGADIPFFLYGYNALAEGIGDKLSFVEPSTKKYLVISPNICSSTTEMFELLDKHRKAGKQEKIQENQNSFLIPFLDRFKEVNRVYPTLQEIHPLSLSGTGSTLFYAYDDFLKIEKSLKKIPTKWRHSFCEPLQCSPLLTYLT